VLEVVIVKYRLVEFDGWCEKAEQFHHRCFGVLLLIRLYVASFWGPLGVSCSVIAIWLDVDWRMTSADHVEVDGRDGEFDV
jgi:hypothetical protein